MKTDQALNLLRNHSVTCWADGDTIKTHEFAMFNGHSECRCLTWQTPMRRELLAWLGY